MILILLTLLSAVFYVSFITRIIIGLRRVEEESGSKIEQFPNITVIIPFRNEEEVLPASLNSLERQMYPSDKLNVIYINDNSTDGSLEVFENYDGSLKYKIINNDSGGKKSAIDKAVREARSNYIAITDADCVHPAGWLKSLVERFDEETGFVAGPVLFESDGRLFGELQKLEFAGIVIASAGLIGSGTPFTCSAANIAFRKDAFLEVNGYFGNEDIPSGDDEFLMQKIAYNTDWKIKYAAKPEAIVETRANKTLSDFLNQRTRWASKGFNYGNSLITFQLLFIFIFFLSIVINFIAGISNGLYLFIGIAAFMLKILADYIAMNKGKKVLFNNLSFKYFPIAEVFQIPYIMFASVLGTFGSYKWKGRRA